MEDAEDLDAQASRNPPGYGEWDGQKVDAETGEALPGPEVASREQPVRITDQTGSRAEPEGWRMGS